eukprot:6840026-Lingulodinium_polyedra.AAC.1
MLGLELLQVTQGPGGQSFQELRRPAHARDPVALALLGTRGRWARRASPVLIGGQRALPGQELQ